MSQFPSMAAGAPAMSAFASTPGLPAAARSHTHYAPRSPQEARQYEALWAAASPAGAPLQGAQAVQFFQRSGLDIQTLKTVWSIATPTSTMTKEQFFTAMRLIAMAQNHEPVNPERLQQLATQDLPAPVISGVQLPQLSGMAGAAGPAGSYNFAEGDLVKYQNLFNQNDKDGDGFVTAADAAALFAQSGLPREVLRELWNLSVPSHDNKLNFREFVVGMHLVVCVSKRHLPVPSTLPPPLRDYLQGADRHGASAAAAPAPQTQTRRPSLDKSSSMSSMDLMGADSFASKPPASAAVASTMPAAGGVPKELQTVTSELVDQARRGAEAVNSISTSSNMAASTLSELVQKLKAEKISLNAAISSAEEDSRVLSGKLEASAQEIDGLRRELDSLRTRYREIQEQMMDDQAKAGGSEKEKEMLLREINNCRQMIDQLHATRGTLLAQVSEVNARAAGLEGQAAAVNELAAGYKQDIESAKGDLAMMRALLGSYNESRGALSSDVDGLQAQLRASKERAERVERELQQRQSELEQLRSERDRLDREKRELALQLSQGKAGAVTTTAAPASPQPAVAAPVKVVSTSLTSDFGAAPSVPAKTSSIPSVFGHDEAFGNGFGNGAASDATSTKSAPAQPTNAFESDPFGEASSTKSAPAVPTTAPPADDATQPDTSFGAFGAFEATPMSAGAGFDADFGPSSPANSAAASKPAEKAVPAIPTTKPTETPAATAAATSPFDSFGADAFAAFPDSADAFASGGAGNDGFSTDAFGSAGGDVFGNAAAGFGSTDGNGFGSFADFGSSDGKAAPGFDDAFGSANAFEAFK